MSTLDAAIRTPFPEGAGHAENGQEAADSFMQETKQPRPGSPEVEKEASDLRDKSDEARVESLAREKAALVEKLGEMEKHVAEIEEENQDLATKYVRISQQNETLTNLYVASYQLHSTLDPHEVLEIVREILINLVGAEEFAVFLVDKTTNELTPVTGEGTLPRLASGELKWNEDILERVVRTGDAFYLEERGALPGGPLACVPLKIKDKVAGAIAIFKLLVQKEGFTLMDSEILHLLAGHAATAIVASNLYADAERKLKTIEGFMELLIHPDSHANATELRPEAAA